MWPRSCGEVGGLVLVAWWIGPNGSPGGRWGRGVAVGSFGVRWVLYWAGARPRLLSRGRFTASPCVASWGNGACSLWGRVPLALRGVGPERPGMCGQVVTFFGVTRAWVSELRSAVMAVWVGLWGRVVWARGSGDFGPGKSRGRIAGKPAMQPIWRVRQNFL